MSKKDYLEKIHSKYIFIEEDISKFREMFFVAGEDIEEEIYKYIANKIINDGLIDFFKKVASTKNIDDAFTICNEVLNKYNIDVSEDDLEVLYSDKKYQDFYNKLIKRKKIKDIDNINIKNELLRKVIEAKVLLSQDIKIEDIKKEDYENLSDDILRDYLISIKDFSVLTREEEKELYERYINGDEEAKTELINHNLKLVVSIAKKMKPPNLNMEMIDYIQEGNIGLLKAVDKFNPSKGYKFSTYAYWWIRQALGRSVDNSDSIIRIPVNMQEKLRKYHRNKREFVEKYYREPTDEEMIEILKISEKTYSKIKEVLNLLNVDSIDRNIENDGKKDRESKLGDFLVDKTAETLEEKVERGILHDQEEKIMDEVLTQRESYVIRHRMGFGTEKATLEEIGNRLGVTRERVRQIEANSIKKLAAYGEEIKKEEIIKDIINGKENEEMAKKSIYELVGVEYEKLNEIINTELTEEEKELIEKRNKEKLSKEENQKFFLIVSKLRNKTKPRISSKNEKTIYDSVNADRKIIDKIIDRELTEEERIIVRKKGFAKLTKEETRKYHPTVAKIRRKIEKLESKLEEKKIEEPIKEEKLVKVETNDTLIDSYKQLLNLALKDPRVIQELDIMDISITCVRYGIGKSKEPRDIETISKFYKISKEEVESISTNVLEKLYNIIVGDIKENNEKFFIKKNDENNQ